MFGRILGRLFRSCMNLRGILFTIQYRTHRFRSGTGTATRCMIHTLTLHCKHGAHLLRFYNLHYVQSPGSIHVTGIHPCGPVITPVIAQDLFLVICVRDQLPNILGQRFSSHDQRLRHNGANILSRGVHQIYRTALAGPAQHLLSVGNCLLRRPLQLCAAKWTFRRRPSSVLSPHALPCFLP